MGLPIWRDPDEKKSAAQIDPTACLRSSIRRRPEVHGRRSQRTRLIRQPTASGLPPRFERSPPPSSGFNGLRDQRRGENRSVPSISNLLEAAERHTRFDALPPPAPPVPDARSYDYDGTTADFMHRHEERMEAMQRRQQELRQQREEFRAQRVAELERQRDRMVASLEANEEIVREHFRNNPMTWQQPDGPVVDGPVDVNPRETLQIIRSPEQLGEDEGRDAAISRRNTLPTPPLDSSGAEDVSFTRAERRLHPLSNSWRAGSPVNGLGDRIRSPTPGDAWEIMRETITPDETLPSAESSFASAAASQAFNTASNGTHATDATTSTSNNSRRQTSEEEDDSASSISEDDLDCLPMDGTELRSTESLAEDMWYLEMRTPEGRERIARHEAVRNTEGNRFAMASEPLRVDIGFRLIEEAIETEDGRQRVLQLRRSESFNVPVDDMLRHILFISRRVRNRHLRLHNRSDSVPRTVAATAAQHDDEEPPSPRPERYGESTRDVVRTNSQRVHDYFRRVGADESLNQSSPTSPPQSSPNSPPPQYSPHPEDNIVTTGDTEASAEISRDRPIPHPVSPPNLRSVREVSDALLTGDVHDLDNMRRIIERLAQRDDVPEEWWMSMGLNLSRSRPASRRENQTRVGHVSSDPRSRYYARVERRGTAGGERSGSRL